jgi:hypothetical protein
VESVRVIETRNGEAVWDGTDEMFHLLDHLTAERAYAWAHDTDAAGKARYVAVLHAPPLDSPQAAVRAAVVAEYRENT